MSVRTGRKIPIAKRENTPGPVAIGLGASGTGWDLDPRMMPPANKPAKAENANILNGDSWTCLFILTAFVTSTTTS